MSSWTPERSALLSLLLDDVTGSQEATHIRQDHCMIFDAIMKCNDSCQIGKTKYHYTGSKSEGLDLPGSDDDIMLDINGLLCIKVVPSLRELSDTPFYRFLLCTKSDNPCFALLRHIGQQTEIIHTWLKLTLQNIKGHQYISSNLLTNVFSSLTNLGDSGFNVTRKRTGPSLETWWEHDDKNESGTDVVPSLHCEFWPNDASEWQHRRRLHGWPTLHDISAIVNFGCHLVPVGHANSETKLVEWRISFSIAEKILVWSFNHVQMQCYAVMKIILKEFIKEKCSRSNQVLCSYFIKTFVFWQYETTSSDFWRESNFRECIKYLLLEFSKCIREGKLRHYFIPGFNLLSVKLTHSAKTELLQLFDIIIHCDISILKDCRTLQNVWHKFLSADENQINLIYNERRNMFLKDDKLTMTKLNFLLFPITQNDRYGLVYENILNNLSQCIHKSFVTFPWSLFNSCFAPMMKPSNYPLERLMTQILPLPCKSGLKTLVVNRLQLEDLIKSLVPLNPRNTDLYRQQIVQDDAFCDISTAKLWYAIALLKQCEYNVALSVINEVLSSIPPFALCELGNENCKTNYLYVDKFLDSSDTTVQRAGKAWLSDMVFTKNMTEILPLGIQIEQYFCDSASMNVRLSPYVCAYYLMFLCYHELRQFNNRYSALRQLIDGLDQELEETDSQANFAGHNIAGHCLLIAGDINKAREMFMISRMPFLMINPLFKKLNSSPAWYLSNFCS